MQTLPPRRKKRRKWPWIVLVLVLLLIAAFVLSLRQTAAQSLTEEIAQRRDIVTYYSFSGSLIPVTDEVQTAKDALKVKELYVQEGDRVEEGDALLRSSDGTRVYAAYSGTIEELYVETDDSLQPGSQIARIVDYDALEVSVRHPENGALLEVAELLSGVEIADQPAPNIAMVYASGGAPAFYMIVEPGTSTLTAPAVLKYSYSAPLFGHPDDLGDAAMAADATVGVALDNLKDKLVARETLQTGALFRSGLDGKAAFTDIVGAAWQMLLADAGDAADDAASKTRKLAVLAESMQALAGVDGRMTALAAVAVAATLEDMTAPGWSVEALDQAALADAAQSTMRAMLAVLDTVTVADDAAGTFRMLALADETLTVGDTPHAALRAMDSLADGAAIYATLRIGGSDYAGWVLNTDLRAVTEYRNVPFDSFAILNGRTYAAGDGGIFELAGNTDDGKPISAWFRPFLTNFGTQKMKRVTDIWLGTSATGLFVKVHTRNPATGQMTEDVYPVQHTHGDGTDKGRVKVGRGLTSNWWTLTVQNVAGADFAIDGIEWKPLLLDRRQ